MEGCIARGGNGRGMEMAADVVGREACDKGDDRQGG